VRGTKGYPVNDGLLCAKGIYQWQSILPSDRGKHPLIRKDGKMAQTTWDEALNTMTGKFKDLIAKYGPDSVACYNTGQLAMEEFYVLGKLMRAGIGTANLDGNTRMCMASAVVGHNRSFGTDGPVGAYADIEEADVIMIPGPNLRAVPPVSLRRGGWGEGLLGGIARLGTDHGFHSAVARIVGGHEASIALHRKCGFEEIGCEREVGRKFGRWLDVVLMQRML